MKKQFSEIVQNNLCKYIMKIMNSKRMSNNIKIFTFVGLFGLRILEECS